MERIGLVGVSWRRGGPEMLARYTIALEERAAFLTQTAREVGLSELVYLATCNRVEIAFVRAEGQALASYRPRLLEVLAGEAPAPGEAERTLRAWAGEGAVEHLFLVAAGLDSARVGDSEVAGQVRSAWDLSRELGLTGPRLDAVFEEALRVARRVRSGTALSEGRQSMAEIGLDHLRARLKRTPGAVALVGVSDMTRRCAEAFAGQDTAVFIFNRTFERAEALAREVGGTPRPLAALREAPDPVEALLSATGAPDPVLGRPELERLAAAAPSGEAPLVVDMAVPPDVDPEAARAAGVPRVGMDQILAQAEENRARSLARVADARQVVDEALLGLRRKLSDRWLAPLMAELQRRYRGTAVEGVERLFRKQLSGLGMDERAAVRRWAETLARRFAHLPSEGLRAVALEAGPSAVEAFLQRADPSMLEALRDRAGDPEAVTLPDEDPSP